jgi:hypothetical protein
MIMTHTEDDTFEALRRVPFLPTWKSIGFAEGESEKRNLEAILRIGDDAYGGDDWQRLFDGWTWKEYKNACRDLYNRKYK